MYRGEENDAKSLLKSRCCKGFMLVSILISLILIGTIIIVKPPSPVDSPAFGSLYGNGVLRPVVPEVPIEFDTRGPFLNTDPDPATNTIEILTSGVYEVTATISVEFFNPQLQSMETFFYIRVNDEVFTPEPAFIVGIRNAGLIVATGKTMQIPLNTGDELSVVPFLEVGEAQYAFASLTVNRIGPLVPDSILDN